MAGETGLSGTYFCTTTDGFVFEIFTDGKPSLGDLDRDMLLQYVEKINVFEGRKIEIVYRFQDELVTAARLAEQIGKTKQEVAV